MCGRLVFTELTSGNFFYNSLDTFKRRQSVSRCWRKAGESFVLMPVSYIEDWSVSDCRELARRILRELSLGSKAFAAVSNNETVGFALIVNKLFGSESQYIDLAEFYVSAPCRRQGIGRKLFGMACNAAKEFGGKKLYISAHSAEESIAAYESYGCTFAKEINVGLAEKEPFDLPLEYDLYAKG